MPQGQQLPQGWSIAPIVPPATTTPPPPAPPQTGTLGQPVEPGSPTIQGQLVSAAKNLGQTVNPWNAVEATAQATYHPLDTFYGFVASQDKLLSAAKDAWSKGDYDMSFVHFANFMANAVPGLGSASSVAGDKMRAGDYGGGMGMGVGMGVNASVGVRPGLVGQAASGVASAAKTAGTMAKTHGIPLAVGAGTQYALTKAGFPHWAAAELAIPAMAAAHPTLRGFMRELVGAIRGRVAPAGAPSGVPPVGSSGAPPAATVPARVSRPGVPAGTAPAAPARARGAGRPVETPMAAPEVPEPVAPPPAPAAAPEPVAAPAATTRASRSKSAPQKTLTRAELTPDELTVLDEYMAKGESEADMLDGIRVFREQQAIPESAKVKAARRGPAKAQSPEPAAEPAPEVPANLKLSQAEGLEYQRLRKFGNSHEKAMALIETQRAMVSRLGLDPGDVVRQKIADRNSSGRWDDPQ